jgi:mono/diheme cytochrome c family protein
MRLKGYLAAGLFIFAVFGARSHAQDSSKKSPKDSVYAELSKVPEKNRAKQNPLEKDPDAVAAGKIIFEEHCAECHEATAQGGKKGPSLRAAEVQEATPGALFWVLSNGVVRKGMPVWSKLPEPQRWQLVSFIKSLGVVPEADKSQEKP